MTFKEIAKGFGLEIGQEFKIKKEDQEWLPITCWGSKYAFFENGLMATPKKGVNLPYDNIVPADIIFVEMIRRNMRIEPTGGFIEFDKNVGFYPMLFDKN